jgi:hypothetical protein
VNEIGVGGSVHAVAELREDADELHHLTGRYPSCGRPIESLVARKQTNPQSTIEWAMPPIDNQISNP